MRELYQPRLSSLHQRDARVKVIFTFAFILSLSLTPYHAWPAYVLFFTLILSITLLSRLGVAFVLKRALLAVPFVLAAMPLIFTGSLLRLSVNFFQVFQVVYSPEGFERFTSIAIKSWISVQAAIILAATTRFPDLLAALRMLKVPRLFVAIIGLMWRYLFVIDEEVIRMLRARNSRNATLAGSHHSGGSLLWRARVTGGMAGSLFLRSLERSERVYAAMLSRGYNGEPPIFGTYPLPQQEKISLILGILLLSLLLILGFLTGG